MNRLILGTVQFGLKYGINNHLGQPDVNTVNEILNLAHQLGINTLDTAEAYGTAHEIIGNYHYNNKFEFKINTKFSSVKKENFIEQVKKTCELLEVKKLNVCFYHSYAEYLHGTLEQGFETLVNLDLIDQVGVSVYTNEELEVVINDPLVNVIQLPFNLFDNFYQRGDLISKAKNKGKKIQVRSIFLQGLFFVGPKSLKGNLAELEDDILFLNKIVNDFKISMADLCLQYVLSFKEIDQIIIGVETPSQLFSNSLSYKRNISSEIINLINSVQIKNKSLLYPYNWK
jgi:aryl-alcohol dehydrogenase-like predicted oxidoreductase